MRFHWVLRTRNWQTNPLGRVVQMLRLGQRLAIWLWGGSYPLLKALWHTAFSPLLCKQRCVRQNSNFWNSMRVFPVSVPIFKSLLTATETPIAVVSSIFEVMCHDGGLVSSSVVDAKSSNHKLNKNQAQKMEGQRWYNTVMMRKEWEKYDKAATWLLLCWKMVWNCMREEPLFFSFNSFQL